MSKRTLWSTALLLLVGTAFFATPDTSEAQRRGYGGGRGWSGGSGWGNYNRGYGPGFYGPGISFSFGSGYNRYPGYSRSYYPGYTRYSNYPQTYYAYPQTYTESTPYYDSYYPPQTYDYQPAAPAVDPNAASFMVHLPDPNAEVWFDNYKTQQRGSERHFTSGNLSQNQNYTFHIRARWTENGRPVERTRDVAARAGQQVHVDFRSPSGG